MIRIQCVNLSARVDAARPTWRSRAASFTTELKAKGSFSAVPINGVIPPNWSDIKSVFMKLQHNKCAYCERQLETAHELDVEHFRPKSKVTPWVGPPLPPGQGRASGYWWLAFDIENYCVACKPCNSGLKADHFPIAGVSGPADADVSTLNTTEQPLLVFPFGSTDVDPESVIGWCGTTPVPLPAPGTPEHARAEATIAFFLLADPARQLDRQRRDAILALWLFIDTETDPAKSAAERARAAQIVDNHATSAKLPMRGCVRAFVALARRDRAEAVRIVNALQLWFSTDT